MDIIIQSLGFKAGEALESFVREKLDTVKSDRIIRANVTLYLGSDGNPENKISEIKLEVPGNDMFVKKGSEHFETAIAECVEVLKHQVNRERDKYTASLKADAEKIQDALIAGEESDEDVDLEDVVK